MAQVLRHVTFPTDSRLLVDSTTGDDAAVWLLDKDRALVLTADFITPIVDDAHTWGRIAATNAVSDVYAMGGTPLLALNLVAWNNDDLPDELLAEVLNGAASVASQAGFLIAGGHTIADPAPKFGLAVVGEVHPDRLLTNAGLLPDQSLLLSKPIGSGIAATAVKRELASAELQQAMVESMTLLNSAASRIAVDHGATGATDVTGFGLLGHLGRAAAESGVDVTLHVANVPLLPQVRELTDQGIVPGGTRRNLASIEHALDHSSASESDLLLLADAQTSGGLVFGVDTSRAESALKALLETGHQAAIVGTTTVGAGRIRLT